MPKFAIISDIHANWEALQNAMKYIEEQGITMDRILCMGDVIGYGPNPVECVDVAIDFKLNLLGNHEEAVINGAFGFNPAAKRAIDWTRNQLKPGVFSSGQKKRRWEFVRTLPLMDKTEKYYFVHGSPRDPTMEYILKVDTEAYFGEIPPKIREIFAMIHGPCFVGHSHVPCIITEDNEYHDPASVDYEYKLEPGKKYIVNVGSVGQPRDQDNRSCFVILDDDENTMRWVRLEYDYNTTAEKIRAIPELDNRNAERLIKGL